MSGLKLAGYASLFGVVDLAGDVVAAGAFRASLLEWPPARIPMLYQHDPARRIGTWDRVEEDDSGLWVEGRLSANLPAAVQAAALIQADTMRGLSIGFRTRDAVPRPSGGRILREIALREVSLVAFPMLPGARLRLVSDPALSGDATGPAHKPSPIRQAA